MLPTAGENWEFSVSNWVVALITIVWFTHEMPGLTTFSSIEWRYKWFWIAFLIIKLQIHSPSVIWSIGLTNQAYPKSKYFRSNAINLPTNYYFIESHSLLKELETRGSINLWSLISPQFCLISFEYRWVQK